MLSRELYFKNLIMKIVRLTTLLDFGGQERKYLSFTEDKSKLQHEYIFAALGYGGFTSTELMNRGFTVELLNLNFKLFHFSTLWKVYRWFKKIKPDVVHTAAVEANFYGVLAAKLAGVKIIIAEEIGIPKHSKKTQLLMRLIYLYTQSVICVSAAVKEYLIKIGEIQEKKGIVIYNPVASKPFYNSTLSGTTIICVGRLETVKNQKILLLALTKTKHKNLKLILVGDGRERNNLESIIKNLQLEEQVTITGFVPNPEAYLAQGDLFVLPSKSEGFGIAVLEAMQQGIPCLCTNVGGVPEFIEEGVNGWLFNPLDENELVAKIDAYFDLNLEERQKIGAAGRLTVQNGFTEAEYVLNLEELYTSWN